jgi:hypothetical protein
LGCVLFALLVFAAVFLFFPVIVVPDTVHVVFGQAEHFEGRNQKLQLCLHITFNFNVIDLMLKEVRGRLAQLEPRKPLLEAVFFHKLARERFLLFLLFRLVCVLFILLLVTVELI